MSKREKSLIITFIILALAMLMWRVWPQKMVERTFSYDEDAVVTPLQSCLLSSGITNGDWKISYPEGIEYKGTSDFVLTYFPSTPLFGARNPTDDCQLLLVARIDVKGAKVEPGETIYAPFDREKVGRTVWKLTAIGGELVGKLWIYTQTNTGKEQMNLFAIPVEIRVFSVLGLQPDLIRIIIGALSLTATLFIWARPKRKSE